MIDTRLVVNSLDGAAARGAREQRDRDDEHPRRLHRRRTRRCASSSSRARPTTTAPSRTTRRSSPRTMRRPHPPRTALERDIVEAEEAVAEFAEQEPGRHGHRAALRQRARARRRHRFTRMFSLPLVPMVLGFDPRLQFVHEDDVVHALEHAALQRRSRASTTSPPTGSWRSRRSIGLLGKRPLPVLPPWGTGPAGRARCAGSASGSPTRWSTSCASAAGSTTACYKATGFDYGYTSRETVLKLGEHLRLRAGDARASSRRYTLRARGRGVPALEPARAARAARRARRRRRGPRAARNLKRRRDAGLQRRLQRTVESGGPRAAPYTFRRLVGRKLQIALVFARRGAARWLAVGAYALGLARSSDQIADGVTIGGVDVGGLTADEARKAVDDAAGRAAATSRSRSPSRASSTCSAPRSSRSAPTSTAWSTRRSRRARTAACRPGSGATRPAARSIARSRPQITYSARRARRASSARSPTRSTATPRRRDGRARRPPRSNAVPGQDGVTGRRDRAALAARVGDREPAATARSSAPGRPGRARGDDRRARRSSTRPTSPSTASTFTAALWKNLKLAKTYTVAVGQPAYPTPDRPLLDRDKQVDPVWNVPDSAWAGDLAGTTVRRRPAENPLKARWMGFYDGAGIHGTDDVGSLGTRRLARLHPDGGPRRDRALRPGPGRHPDLHRRLRRLPSGSAAGRLVGEAQPRASDAPWQPTAEELELSPAWEAALERLRARAARRAAPRRHTLRAYGARPARARRRGRPGAGAEPGELAYRDLRAYAAALSERGLARSSVARKLAAVRSLHDHLVRDRRRARRTRPTSCRRPKRDSRLPRVLGPRRDRGAARPDPGRGRRSRSATGRCSSSPTPAGCAPRRSSRSTSTTLDFESETLRVTGKGAQDAARPDRRARAARAASATSRRRAPRSAADRDEPALFVSRRGRRLSPSDVRRRLERWVREAAVAGPRLAAHAAPLVRHPPARGRRRPALDPGAAGTLERLDHAGLHAGRAVAAAQRVRKVSPARLSARRISFPDWVRGVRRWRRTSKQSSCGSSGGATRTRATSRRASASSSPTRRWSSSSPAGWPRGCPRTSRSPTSSPTACSA